MRWWSTLSPLRSRPKSLAESLIEQPIRSLNKESGMPLSHSLLLRAMFGIALVTSAATVTYAHEADTLTLVSTFNTSGYQLFRQLVDRPGNVVFSPYSIGSAMAMISSGAARETAAEMDLVLHQQLDHDRMDAANSSILKILNVDRTSTTEPACQSGMKEGPCEAAKGRNRNRESTKLRVANAVILTKEAVASSEYVNRLKTNYAAEVFRNAGLEQVNNWVSRVTDSRIDRILDRLPKKGLVLVDAVHFKQPWQRPFLAAATVNEDFHISPTTTIKVATMHQRGYFPLMSGLGFRAIRLPYLRDSLSMVVVLPDAIDGATMLARRLDADELTKLLRELRSKDVYTALSLPRFKVSFIAEFKDDFQKLGLLRPFDENRADFSGIVSRSNERAKIWIDNVVQRAALKITENGTEAAAATANSLVEITSAQKPPSEPFTVDRPFLLYITDDDTGLILFAGRISDPSRMN